jgi:hypothetical protein
MNILPTAILAAAGTLLGLSVQSPPTYQIPIAILVMILFVLLMVFKTTPTWNGLLLLTFSLSLGAVIRATQLYSVVSLRPVPVVLIGSIGIGSSLVFARSRFITKLTQRVVWIGAGLYIGGWMVLGLFQLGTIWIRSWAFFGILLFIVLLSLWILQLDRLLEHDTGTPAAIELYLIGCNILICILLLSKPLA